MWTTTHIILCRTESLSIACIYPSVTPADINTSEVDLVVGTPPQRVSVILDTGSGVRQFCFKTSCIWSSEVVCHVGGRFVLIRVLIVGTATPSIVVVFSVLSCKNGARWPSH